MLRDEITKLCRNIYASPEDFVDSILALIDGQRCRWTHNAEYYSNLYHTSCGKVLSEDSFDDRPFCPFCGKRIGVVE